MPVFTELTQSESLAVLKRNKVGRIAYSLHDRVMIEPVHYALDGDWLYVRTSPGSKTHLLAHNRWVAFEVDEPTATFHWKSVTVQGAVYVLAPDAPPDLVARFNRAVPTLRRIVPETYTAKDPVAFRTIVLGIHLDAVTGRAARV